MTASLDGKVVLITGTGGGQGRAAALRFAGAGALVVGCDVKEEGNRETAALVREAGGSITTMEPVDLERSAKRPALDRGGRRAARPHRRSVQQCVRGALCADRVVSGRGLAVHGAQRVGHRVLRHALRVAASAEARRRHHQCRLRGRHGRIGRGRHGACGDQGRDHRDDPATGRRRGASRYPRQFDQPRRHRIPGTAPMLADPAFRELMLAHNLIKRVGQPKDVVAWPVSGRRRCGLHHRREHRGGRRLCLLVATASGDGTNRQRVIP